MHPLTNLPKKTQPGLTCPVTGLPLREKPEWDVQFGKEHRLTLRVLGENILVGRPVGSATPHELKAGLALWRDVAEGLAGTDRRYIYIVDLKNAEDSTREARQYDAEHMKNQSRLLGLIFISASPLFKIGVKLAKRMRRRHYHLEIVDNYEAAVELALEMLSADETPKGEAPGFARKEEAPAPAGKALRGKVFAKDDWRLELDAFSMRLEVINGNILHSYSRGVLKKEHIEPIAALRVKVNDALGPERGVDYFINCVKDLKRIDRKARRLYVKSIMKWHERRPVQMFIQYGLNRFTRAALNLARPFMPFKMRAADDLESALAFVENHEKARGENVTPARPTAPAADASDDARLSEYVDDLLEYIGRIDWEVDGVDPYEKPDPLHPLTPVYESIALVKGELDAIFEERERVESALRESEDRFREILKHSRDILFKRNIQTGGYEYISDAVTALFGYTREESDLMGFNGFVNRFHPDDRADYQARMDALLKSEPDDATDHAIEYRLKGKDGSYRWLRNIHALLRDPDGSPRFLIGSSRDVTERKKDEHALKEGHERFLAIMDSIDARIYVSDMATHEILFVNKRIKDEHDRDLVGEICWKALRGREGPCGECTDAGLLDADGRPADESRAWEERDPNTGRWRLNHERAIKWVDGRYARLEIGTDITRIKQLEKERREEEEERRLPRKLEAMGAMAEGIAHNFNNSLMAVMGNLELVLLDLPPDSPFEGNLNAAEKAAGKAAELSTLMMTYVGQGAAVKKTIHLNELVEEMKPSLETHVPDNADMTFDASTALTPIKGDPDQIRQVIVNLMINASEAVRETGGEITLTTGVAFCERAWFKRQLLKKGAPDGDYVFVEVADAGPGMDKETVEKVSDPFFTTKFAGRGLGMAAVAGIMRGHKGGISLQSEPGKGTVVRALFPAIGKPPAEIPTPRPAPADEVWRGSGTVLLVDDEEIALAVGKAMLEKMGFHVLTALNGLEAVEIFRERAADIRLVVLDITMPVMDGGEAYREMQKIDPGVRALISSGYTESRMAGQFEKTPPASFLHKPFKMKEFSQKIKKVLERNPEKSELK